MKKTWKTIWFCSFASLFLHFVKIIYKRVLKTTSTTLDLPSNSLSSMMCKWMTWSQSLCAWSKGSWSIRRRSLHLNHTIPSVDVSCVDGEGVIASLVLSSRRGYAWCLFRLPHRPFFILFGRQRVNTWTGQIKWMINYKRMFQHRTNNHDGFFKTYSATKNLPI